MGIVYSFISEKIQSCIRNRDIFNHAKIISYSQLNIDKFEMCETHSFEENSSIHSNCSFDDSGSYDEPEEIIFNMEINNS